MKIARLFLLLTLCANLAAAQKKPLTPKPATSKPVALTKPTATGPSVTAPGLPADEFYYHFVLSHADAAAAVPVEYGTTTAQPIPVGVYEDLADKAKGDWQLKRFLKTYLWQDGSRIVFIDRKSRMIDNVNYDIFRVTKAGSKDTLTLYADMYRSAPVSPPNGFRFYTKEEMAAELAPIADQIKRYDAVPDKYSNEPAKQAAFQLLSFFQSSVGLDYLLDINYIAPVLNDNGIDLDLRAFLIRSFMMHSFLYGLNGLPDAKTQAFNTMVDDYQAVVKTHDILSKGNLALTMVKR